MPIVLYTDAKGDDPVINLPKYEHPPLSEVIFGVAFTPPPRFLAAHIGMFWDCLREKYPIAKEQPPIARQLEEPDGQIQFPVFPRTWFCSTDDSELVQLQHDMLLFNWKAVAGDYPHFAAIYEKFSQITAAFSAFCEKQELGIGTRTSYELTYINHIIPNDFGFTLSDTGEVFRFNSSMTPIGMPQLETFRQHYTFDIPKVPGRLYIEVNSGKRKVDLKDVFILNLSMRGFSDDLQSWFNNSHAEIVNSFTSITTETMQRHWKRIM